MDLPHTRELGGRADEVARRSVGELVPHLRGDLPDGILARLKATSGLRSAVDALLTELVVNARDEGATWAEIGEVLGVSTQAAHQKYRHVAALAAADNGHR